MEEEEGEVDYGSIGEHLDLWMYRQLSDRVTYNRTPHAHRMRDRAPSGNEQYRKDKGRKRDK
ncbi:hypothetical protein ALC53_08351 [Atta colombica]|uniref:Uncharacterized protein n=1 Tax=Atta colombica TaxID=520822 RepID=A0A195BAN4_9HYME|nr:hypothetical protein ALC53_08351 [Atta colombica]